MKKLFCGKYRKTIGITVGVMDTHYDRTLVRAVRKAAVERDINLLILVCGSMKGNLNHNYEYQNNIMYYMPTTDSVDGLILLPSIIYNYSEITQLRKLLDHYQKIPLITLSEPVEGYPAIVVDNSSGVRELVNHLYLKHGKRSFAFVSGPENNSEAQKRLEGFLMGMKDVGLEPLPHYIIPGDFWTTGGRNAVKILESCGHDWPEVIVCSNDYSALGVYEELEKRGIPIPDKISVTGFDNMQAGCYSFPPLTSIEQPLEDMAAKAVELLDDMIDGKSVPHSTIMPSQVVYRWSTGCSRWDPDCSGTKNRPDSQATWKVNFVSPELNDKTNKWLQRIETADQENEIPQEELLLEFSELLYLTVSRKENLGAWNDLLAEINQQLLSPDKKHDLHVFVSALQSRLAEIRELYLGLQASQKSAYTFRQSKVVHRILSVFTANEMIKEIIDQFPKLGIGSFFMSIYSKSFNHYLNSEIVIPETSRWFFGYCRDNEIPSPSNHLFDTRQLLPDFVNLPDEPLAFVVLAASFRETHYGYIIMEASVDDDQVYNNLASQISTAYRGILIFNEKEQKARELSCVLAQLKQSNRRLEEISTRDSLTSLYNRRGFISLGEKFHEKALIDKTDYILFYADLDDLKTINDTWGHCEGDEAIKAFGKILEETFRVVDIVARLGGDEFTVCTSNTGPQTASIIRKRLMKNVQSFNSASGKPWKLSFSIGYVMHSEQKDLSFFENMSLADTRLYENKRIRKKNLRS
ncbi:MAG: GGDEF domain-containing protein [Chitinispirillaceae bacterium]